MMAELLDVAFAIGAAYLLALPLAREREGGVYVGLRTIPLVSVGACAYILLSRHLYEQGIYNADGLARTLRALMTGIGFIGGGAIVKNVRDVHGIATGVAVWNTGAIGAAVAHGLYVTALMLALANVLIFELAKRLAGAFGASNKVSDTPPHEES
jgi:putative Mg2+ transporter-C (MgtC) family protein